MRCVMDPTRNGWGYVLMLEWEYSSHVISGLHEQQFSGIREPKHSSYSPKSDVVALHVIHEVTRATPLVVQTIDDPGDDLEAEGKGHGDGHEESCNPEEYTEVIEHGSSVGVLVGYVFGDNDGSECEDDEEVQQVEAYRVEGTILEGSDGSLDCGCQAEGHYWLGEVAVVLSTGHGGIRRRRRNSYR
ncbi:hypothetical protein Acr_26g0000420 [Actinidia rufa]|uniref:Uncharacterized protein n=1 Tax=Actinidia rufa TaxID=165716 RepID=A0A7J0H151_9ERIC|nr:hypothetical protein Acr_26g0000420 [Actinidia rufa]